MGNRSREGLWLMAQNRDGGQSGLALFAAELAAVRAAAGLSQADLAAKINYSDSLIAMIERQRRVPSLDFAKRCDAELGTPGTFERLQQNARTAPLPAWFRPWADVEATATQLRMFEHAIIPGLFQTEDYARAVLAVQPNVTADELDEIVTARMDRQAVLSRTPPPLLWAVIDEFAMHRLIGGAKVMSEQLMLLAHLSEQPNVTIQVIPAGSGAHCGLSGALAVGDIDGAAGAAYLETVMDGYISESPSVVAGVILAFDTLRSEALPRGASRDLIMKWAEDYAPDD
jgi:transcriptional regulator with XRE-family HTH domain